MPNFVKTPNDEKCWKNAKQAANKTLNEDAGDNYWALVNNIYHKMKKTNVTLDTLYKVKALLEAKQLKKADDYDEEDLEGMRVFNPEEEEQDDADKWLQENDPQADSEPTEVSEEGAPEKAPIKSRSRYRDWTPHKELKPGQTEKIKSYIDEGYSEREAYKLAGAGKAPSDFMSALKHSINPSKMSPKMFELLRPLAEEWSKNARKHSYATADPKTNPERYTRGQLNNAADDYFGPLEEAEDKFLEENPNLRGKEKRLALRDFRKKYMEENPQHSENRDKLANIPQKAKEARGYAKKTLEEKLEHIMRGGVGMPTDMTTAEGAQQVGGQKDEGGQVQAAIKKDPLSVFANNNPEFAKLLQGDAAFQNRLKQIGAARMAQGVSAPEPLKQESAAPKINETSALKDEHNQKLLNFFVSEHAPLINLQYNKLKGTNKIHEGVESDDLHMAGYHGLMDALATYDPNSGNKFSTHANNRIGGKMKDHIVASGDIPKTAMKRAKKLQANVAAAPPATPKTPEGEE